MLKNSSIVGLAAASLMAASSATAATSIDVNSGVDANNDKRDDVWKVDADLNAATDPVAAFIPTSIPGTYDGSPSEWLTPQLRSGNSPASLGAGLYTFIGIIDLSSITQLTKQVIWKGTIFSDNSISFFRVNGQTFVPNPAIGGFGVGQGDLFSVAFKALQGNNTFEIGLRNGTPSSSSAYNPAAVRFASTVSAIPEPGTWMLMILGLGAVGFAMRRRQATSVRLQFA